MISKIMVATIAAVTALGGAGAVGISQVQAQTAGNFPPLIQKMVEKFRLDTTEVNKLMETEKAEREAQREERQAERQKEIEAKLTEAVKNKKISEDQKSKILAKLEEFRGKREDNRPEKGMGANLTPEQRKAQMEKMRAEREKQRTEMEAWEKSVGVKLSDILGELCPMMGGFGMGGPRHGTK